jgi:hypothetical protein
MKNWFISALLLLLIGCKTEKADTYFTTEKASQYFRSVEDLCNRDNGSLWGKNLYGPLMFVDRVSRRIVANQPDKEGLLKGKDGVYTGLILRPNLEEPCLRCLPCRLKKMTTV